MKLLRFIFLGFVYLGIFICLTLIGVLYLANGTKSHIATENYFSDGDMSLDTTRRLHKFHGTLVSEYYKGEWWFERDGKLCKLWDPRRRRR